MSRSRWKNTFVSESLWLWFNLHAWEKKRRRQSSTLKSVGCTRIYPRTISYRDIASIRSSTILPSMEGYIFRVHDGRAYRPVMVKPHMIGTTFGDHVHTKQICVYRRKKNRKQKKMVKGKSLKIKAKSKSKAKVKQKT